MTVQQAIISYKSDNPDASTEEIAKYVRKVIPGARTTPSSVSCTLNRAGISSGRVVNSELPVFDPTAEDSEEETEEETEDEARERINIRYQAMERMAPRAVSGRLPSLIISGPPGVGKSYTVTQAIEASKRQRHDGLTNVGGGGIIREEGFESTGWYDQIQGACTAPGLYHTLWNMRKGGVILLDDCDAVFRDEDALNLLKVATDSTRERLVSWRKNASWLDDYEIDKTFDFKGHIIFLTNVDFEAVIARNHRDAEHFKALIDRSAYLCLTLRTARDFMIRITDVAGGKDGFLAKDPYNLSQPHVKEIMDFIRQHQTQFYNLSLRLVGQIATELRDDPKNWKTNVMATKMRTV